MKDGEDFLLKKSTPKDSQGFGPYQNKPLRGPQHNKKRGSYRKRPYGGNSSQSSNQSFSSGRGKLNFRGSRGRFQTDSRGHYHHWLRSSIHLRTKFSQSPIDFQSGYKALQKELALTSCIQSLLSKNAIERVENVKSLGFYSCLFLVPKPHQGGGQ